MTFRTRILLDRLFASPLAVALNALVRLLGKILNRDHSMDPATTREVVVCKLVGMGSILQATPLLRSLKQRFPGARVTFLSLKGNAGLLKRLEGVDEVLCLDDSSAPAMLWTTATTLVTLIGRRVDHYFDLEVYSGFTCLLSLFSLARNRLGFYRHSNRFKKGIYSQLVYFNTRMPVRRLYLQLGRVAGVASHSDDALGSIRVEDSERKSLDQKLAEIGLKPEERYVLVNANASDLLIERRWPSARYAEAIAAIACEGHNVILIGVKAEAAHIQDLFTRIPEEFRARVFNTAGMLSLGELFAAIERAACVLTNDTGPMHMAFALKRPAVCLFGPGDPTHYGIESERIVILYAPVPCSPCIYEVDEPPCHGNNFCMRRISTESVTTSVLTLLRQDGVAVTSAPIRTAERLPLVWDDETGCILGTVLRF